MQEKETLTRQICLAHIRDAAKRLGRYPKRSDFSDDEDSYIKSCFGPWGRALEAAGVKPPRGEDRLQKNRERRARAKAARRAAASETKKQGDIARDPIPPEAVPHLSEQRSEIPSDTERNKEL